MKVLYVFHLASVARTDWDEILINWKLNGKANFFLFSVGRRICIIPCSINLAESELFKSDWIFHDVTADFCLYFFFSFLILSSSCKFFHFFLNSISYISSETLSNPACPSISQFCHDFDKLACGVRRLYLGDAACWIFEELAVLGVKYSGKTHLLARSYIYTHTQASRTWQSDSTSYSLFEASYSSASIFLTFRQRYIQRGFCLKTLYEISLSVCAIQVRILESDNLETLFALVFSYCLLKYLHAFFFLLRKHAEINLLFSIKHKYF